MILSMKKSGRSLLYASVSILVLGFATLFWPAYCPRDYLLYLPPLLQTVLHPYLMCFYGEILLAVGMMCLCIWAIRGMFCRNKA